MPTKTVKTPRLAITILGAGAIGQAIASLLAKKKIHPLFWDANPELVPGQPTLAAAVSNADIVFCCIPSWTLRGALEDISNALPKNAILVVLTKGFEHKTNYSADQIIKSVLPRQPFALLAGPMLSREITEGRGAAAMIATTQPRVAQTIQKLFSGTTLSVHVTRDVHGTALSSILKNVYAIVLGAVEELSWSMNRKGALVTQCLHEMRQIIVLLGGRVETTYDFAGVGDLIATGLSASSRNHRFGVMLITAKKTPLMSEGHASLAPLLKLLRQKTKPYPVLHALAQVLVKKHNAKQVFETLTF